MKHPREAEPEAAVEPPSVRPAEPPVATAELPRRVRRSGVRARIVEDPEVPCATVDEVHHRHRVFVLRQIQLRLRSWASRRLVEDIFQGVVPYPVRPVLDDLVYSEVRIQTRSEARQRVDGEPDEDAVPTSQPDPEQQVAQAEDSAARKGLLEIAFCRMRPDSAALIRMIELEGLSHEQAAERLGCSTGALAQRLRRARQSFSQALLELKRRL
jgi:RNA polymerase sigma factor (sigma-70 family)